MRVDAHHHLWHYTPAEYGWIDDSMAALRRDFLPADLAPLAAAARVDATLAVQARQTLAETAWLLDLADQAAADPAAAPLRGVVGWAPIAAPDFAATLEALLLRPRLRGLRHVVQAEPAGFLDDPAFNRGIARLRPTGLVYDLLLLPHQLPEAIGFVDRHPGQSFVLDHLAKPFIARAELEPWRTQLTELARRPNVACKLSGLVTEADWQRWTPAALEPYLDAVLEAFTPDRLMAGTDWPVLTVACTYAGWWQTLDRWLAPLSAAERAAIEGLTAARIYHLEL